MENTMRSIYLAAAALAFAIPTQAADLGGDCCADLEERVAELEATVAKKGNRKVSLTIYGQVNAALMWHDLDIPGVPGKAIGQNGTSTSRFGFRGEANITDKVKAGYILEIGIDQEGEPWDPASSLDLSVRHSAVYLQGEMGRLTLGRTSQATDTIDETVVTNTAVASKMLSLQPFSNAYLMGLDLPFDGGRADVVRYDSPSLGGFMASASWSADETWDAALRYAGEFGQIKVAAAVGYRDSNAVLGIPVDAQTITATGSVQHVPSGLFVQGMYGKIDTDFVDVTGYHLQGGLEQKFFSVGKTTIYGEWAELDIDGVDNPSLFGGGLVQAIDAAAMDLYVAYRQYDVMDETVQTVVTGARIKF